MVVALSAQAPRSQLRSATPSLASQSLPVVATWHYAVDVWQRSVLFLDVLRQRAENLLHHERQGLPPLLDFRYETICDARRFEDPANYALLRITEIEGCCLEDCLTPGKAPVIVVDPRAGHGPGIGGFKRESEVGMAMREGHPVYFVAFFPEPMPAQTLADVHHALRRFVAEVRGRHPDTPPVLYGNCQAGWAITLLSADCEGLVGPAVLNGSPLSYWAGESGVNPMRVTGGLLGGVWLAHLAADLGNGRFDGAWLAQNFEHLQPEKAIWEKYAALFHSIDTERERFLEFERWWNGFYFLSREEILAIVENLFIGNQLEQGLFRICKSCYAELRRIRNPLIIFASYGDNITPPHQALGWIPAVYRDNDDLEEAGQRIVYLTNPHVGHLGLFVSAKVARLEHRAILESLDEINSLPPGLYEMTIDNPTGSADCHKPTYSVRFEKRQVAALKHDYPRESFERVREVSEINDAAYTLLLSPWLRMMTNPCVAQWLKWTHPMRVSRYVCSTEFNPWMRSIQRLAAQVEGLRKPLPPDSDEMTQERVAIDAAGAALEAARRARDAGYELLFSLFYGGALQIPNLLPPVQRSP